MLLLANQDIRLAAAGHGVRLWQIADALGILDCTLSRKMRHELQPDEKKRILEIIEKLSVIGKGAK